MATYTQPQQSQSPALPLLRSLLFGTLQAPSASGGRVIHFDAPRTPPKLTGGPTRVRITQCLQQSFDPCTMDEIVRAVGASRTLVQRNLQHLIEAGTVEKIKINGCPTEYALRSYLRDS